MQLNAQIIGGLLPVAMSPEEGDRRRESSPSTGRRAEAHDESREGRGGRGRGFNDTADEHRHGRRNVEYDHRQRTRDASGEHTRKKRDGDDVSDDRSRRTHDNDVRDGHSRRRFDDDSYHRRHEADDANHRRRRHGVNADASESPRRQYRHREGSVRERSPHQRSSYHDKRVGYEEGYSRSSYRGEHRKPDSSGNYPRNVDEDIGRDRFATRDAQKGEDVLPELFSVHRAKVQSVRPFGVFVRLEGFYKQGLVHLSQLSDHEVTDREDSDETKIKAIAAVAGEGDQVWVKVISLKDDGGGVKIGCSLKLVSQSTGKDLDPSNLKLDQQQPKANRQEIKKVTLDAIYNVVCSRCGGHGHLKTECYAMADKTYELIPEEEADIAGQLAQLPQAQTSLEEVSAKPGFGRGRAMVLPAWMTHGSGAAAPHKHGSADHEKKKRKASELPDKISTVEEAMALIAEVKKVKRDKHRRKDHKKHKKDKKSKRSSKKKRSSEKDTG